MRVRSVFAVAKESESCRTLVSISRGNDHGNLKTYDGKGQKTVNSPH